MKKALIYSMAATVMLSGTLISSSLDASAASYKVSKGKLVYAKSGKTVKGKVVYKKKLYNNGKLAKGTILYKGTLYVGGKIKTDAVKFKNKFYIKGKVVSSTKVFMYNDKLYKGNNVYPGFKSYDYQLYKDGKPFNGIYSNTLYNYGQSILSSSGENQFFPIFTGDGTSMTYFFAPELDEALTLNSSDVSISDGASIKSVEKIESTDEYTAPYFVIQIENVQLDHTYELKLNNLTIEKYGSINLSSKVKSLSTNVKKDATYQKALATYTKYSAYTDEQMQKMTSEEFYKLSDTINSYEEYTFDLDDEETVYAINGIIRAFGYILQKSPYFGELY